MAENKIIQQRIKEQLESFKISHEMIKYSLTPFFMQNSVELDSFIFFADQLNGLMDLEHNLIIANLEKLKYLPNNKTINFPIVFHTIFGQVYKENHKNEKDYVNKADHFVPINCKITKNSKGEFGVQIQFDNQISTQEKKIIKRAIEEQLKRDLKVEILTTTFIQNEKLSFIDHKNFGINNCLIDTYYNLQYANDKISNDEMEKIKKLNDNEIRQKFFSDMLVNYFKNNNQRKLIGNLEDNDITFISNLAEDLFDDEDIQNIKDLFTTNKPIAEIIDINALKALKQIEDFIQNNRKINIIISIDALKVLKQEEFEKQEKELREKELREKELEKKKQEVELLKSIIQVVFTSILAKNYRK